MISATILAAAKEDDMEMSQDSRKQQKLAAYKRKLTPGKDKSVRLEQLYFL